MKIIFTLVMYYSCLIQIIDSNQYRIIMNDEILPYHIDKTVTPLTDWFTEHITLEQIDDDTVMLSGYLVALKSMDRNSPLRAYVETRYLYQSTWKDGPFRMTMLDLCKEYVNPSRPFYNITKLWTSDVCPSTKGDIWRIETQNVSMVYNLPSSIPMVPWRTYVLNSQGVPGYETLKFGVGVQSIPMFLPVMRGTLSLPANRDPEVLERLQPIHLKNLCSTLQIHYNSNAKYVAADQSHVSAKVKEVDYEITRIINMITEKQKLYAQYAEHFTKVRYISQQLTRCNTLLNQNIESMEQLNSILDVDDRLEPFVWRTS